MICNQNGDDRCRCGQHSDPAKQQEASRRCPVHGPQVPPKNGPYR